MIRARVRRVYLRWRLADCEHALVTHQASDDACPLQLIAAISHIAHLRAQLAH